MAILGTQQHPHTNSHLHTHAGRSGSLGHTTDAPPQTPTFTRAQGGVAVWGARGLALRRPGQAVRPHLAHPQLLRESLQGLSRKAGAPHAACVSLCSPAPLSTHASLVCLRQHAPIWRHRACSRLRPQPPVAPPHTRSCVRSVCLRTLQATYLVQHAMLVGVTLPLVSIVMPRPVASACYENHLGCAVTAVCAICGRCKPLFPLI